jgi:hypothetical protein
VAEQQREAAEPGLAACAAAVAGLARLAEARAVAGLLRGGWEVPSRGWRELCWRTVARNASILPVKIVSTGLCGLELFSSCVLFAE